MKHLLLLLALFTSKNVLSDTSYWSEGLCNELTSTYEGATRDYLNRASAREWKNKGGDWIDSFFIEQGNKKFGVLKISPNINEQPQFISVDVTNLVNRWKSKGLINNGFFLKPKSPSATIIYSKDSTQLSNHPELELTFHNGEKSYLKASADTELNLSTYRCLGDSPIMSASSNILIRFPIELIRRKVISARLLVAAENKTNTDHKMDVYAVNIPRKDAVQTPGWSNRLNSQKLVKNHSSVIFHESFDTNWEGNWQSTFWGNSQSVNENKTEKFRAINGNALQITVPKGKHAGSTAYVDLSEKKLRKAYLRYFLRFGDSWHANTSGKLPGFAGTYKSTAYAAGWGGRISNGSNGWSARASFGQTSSEYNVLKNKTPIGTYLYHSDMKHHYGDTLAWSKFDDNMLTKNKWYTIEQYIELNTPNRNDGKLKAWINGYLAYSNTNINFTNEPRFNIETIWLNLYYGGKDKAPKDLTLFIDELTVSTDYIGSPVMD